MIVRLSREEMLRLRRISDGLEPLRTDCTVERTDGVDIDALLETELRRRYLELLDTAPREFLAPENLAVKTDCRRVEADGTACALIDVPAEVRRVFGVKMRGWARAVPVLGPDELERVAALQRNRFTAATAWRPAAVFTAGDAGGNIGPVMVWPLTGSYPEVEEFVAVYDPGAEVYALDEAALELLFKT